SARTAAVALRERGTRDALVAPHCVGALHRVAGAFARWRGNPGKKGISSAHADEKSLAIARPCAIFRGDSLRAVLAALRFQSFEEYRHMAKKGGAPTKSEILTQISKDTGLSRKQVGG